MSLLPLADGVLSTPARPPRPTAAAGLSDTSSRLRHAHMEPVGDRCVLVRLGQSVDLATNQAVHAAAALVEASPLPGLIEVVPAFNSLAVHFDPLALEAERGAACAQVIRHVEQVLQQDAPDLHRDSRLVEIPACYGGAFGPDLEDVARHCGLETQEVIALHSGSVLTLYAFFFAPGNPFSGPVDPRLQIERRRTPRLKVEAGSVGLANGLSSIYAATSPGGWNIIARTPWSMFDVNNDPPARLRLGDRLQFKPISPQEYRDLLETRP